MNPSKPSPTRRGFWGVIQWIFLWGTVFGLILDGVKIPVFARLGIS